MKVTKKANKLTGGLVSDDKGTAIRDTALQGIDYLGQASVQVFLRSTLTSYKDVIFEKVTFRLIL